MKIFNLSGLFHKVPKAREYAKEFNTRFVLLNEAADKAISEGILNNKEIEEFRAFFKQTIKNGPVTDTVYIGNVRKADNGLLLKGEFFADPLMCEDVVLTSKSKIITAEELEDQMAEFRTSKNLVLATHPNKLAKKSKPCDYYGPDGSVSKSTISDMYYDNFW